MKKYSYEGEIVGIDYFIKKLSTYREISKSAYKRICKNLKMADIVNGKKVLDIGCNTGYFSFLLHEQILSQMML